MLYKLSLELFDLRVGIIVLILFTFSPLVLTYGHNARYYSMAAVWCLLSAWMAFRWSKFDTWFYILIYLISSVLLVYTLYMGWIFLLALNLWWLFNWLYSNKKLKKLITWITVQVAILLFYYPWIRIMIASAGRNMPAEIEITGWLQAILLRVGYTAYAFSVGEFFSPINPISWVGLILFFILAFFAIVKRTKNLLLPLTIIIFVSGISILFNIVAVYPQSAWQSLSNRMFFIYPFSLIVIAYGISRLSNKWSWSVLVILIFVSAIGNYNYFTNQQVIKPFLIVPWKDIFEEVSNRKSADEVLVCTNDDVACFYYQERFGFPRFSPKNWEQFPDPKPVGVWWIQSYRGDSFSSNSFTDLVFEIESHYPQVEVMNFVPQDPGIMMLKSKFLGTSDYDYRVVVYHFFYP